MKSEIKCENPELDNLNADIKEVKERQEKHDFILQRLDQRLMRLENK